MPVTQLDPKTALVVIDLQAGIVSLPLAHPPADVIKASRQLLDAFRAKGQPVVLVNVAGGAPGRADQSRSQGEPPKNWADLVRELDQQPGDHCVTKRTWGAFSHTDLHEWLQSQGATQIVLCGIATSIGVESTARQGHELGYNVTLAVDAMTDLNAEAHANSVARIFPRLGETGTVAEIVAKLG